MLYKPHCRGCKPLLYTVCSALIYEVEGQLFLCLYICTYFVLSAYLLSLPFTCSSVALLSALVWELSCLLSLCWTLQTTHNGVCGVDKDPPGGWCDPASALSAHGGGNAVFNWPPPHPVLTPGQHRGALAAPRQHRRYREEVGLIYAVHRLQVQGLWLAAFFGLFIKWLPVNSICSVLLYSITATHIYTNIPKVIYV